jgi:hypothetical protein
VRTVGIISLWLCLGLSITGILAVTMEQVIVASEPPSEAFSDPSLQAPFTAKIDVVTRGPHKL